ncbi:histone H4, partial [Salmonella sp. s51228]|uniref:histone H4 n=1 Tax=Salmonella sp. s51228 TaxID=3159652 RepID=UPI00397E9B5D
VNSSKLLPYNSIEKYREKKAVSEKEKKIRYAKHHRQRQTRDCIYGISKGDIRRLARRGGVKRISSLMYDEVRQVLKLFLESLLKDAVLYAEHAKRKTVTTIDVIYALKL